MIYSVVLRFLGIFCPPPGPKSQLWIWTDLRGAGHSGEYDGVVDFEAAVRDPDAPTRIHPRFNSGDGLHPGDAGYAAMAEAVDLELFRVVSSEVAGTR